MEYSQDQLPLLEILIIKKRHKHSNWQKTTDSKLSLPFTSNHPKHTKTNIPFNLTSRICTVVLNYETRNKKKTTRIKIISTQKTVSIVINGQQNKTWQTTDIQELWKKNQLSNILSYMWTNNIRNTEAYNIIHKNVPLLRQDTRMKKRKTKVKPSEKPFTPVPNYIPGTQHQLSKCVFALTAGLVLFNWEHNVQIEIRRNFF